jgi:hypothetical protein
MRADYTDHNTMRLEPTTWAEKRIRRVVRNFIRSYYRQANHRFAIRWIFQIIFDELQDSFTEDNKPTTLAFMVEETLNATGMDKEGLMYDKINEIVS